MLCQLTKPNVMRNFYRKTIRTFDICFISITFYHNSIYLLVCSLTLDLLSINPNLKIRNFCLDDVSEEFFQYYYCARMCMCVCVCSATHANCLRRQCAWVRYVIITTTLIQCGMLTALPYIYIYIYVTFVNT